MIKNELRIPVGTACQQECEAVGHGAWKVKKQKCRNAGAQLTFFLLSLEPELMGWGHPHLGCWVFLSQENRTGNTLIGTPSDMLSW